MTTEEIARALLSHFEEALEAWDRRDDRGGQQVSPRRLDFQVHRPSQLRPLRWWARELREALDADKEGSE